MKEKNQIIYADTLSIRRWVIPLPFVSMAVYSDILTKSVVWKVGRNE